MTTRRLATLAGVLGIALGGCGSSDDGPPRIGCDWFVGDNCWKQTAAEAALCTDGDATGAFNPATTSCAYADGTTLAFSTAANDSWVNDLPWSFSITAAGATSPCAEFRETETTVAVTTSLGTYRENFAGTTVVITCPDGASHQIGAFEALGCGLENLPGWTVVESGGTMTFSLIGAPASDPRLWRCAP